MNQSFSWRDPWSLSLWIFLLMMNFSFALALWAAFSIKTAVIDFVFTLFATGYLAFRTPLTIKMADGWLYVGRAKIELKYVGDLVSLDKMEMSLARTRDLDVNAYLDLRFWVPKGIKIEILDPRDYTPYWLISTNKAEEIMSRIKS